MGGPRKFHTQIFDVNNELIDIGQPPETRGQYDNSKIDISKPQLWQFFMDFSPFEDSIHKYFMIRGGGPQCKISAKFVSHLIN